MDGSLFAIKSQLFKYIHDGCCDVHILELLLPEGRGLLTEKTLWDYKLTLPSVPANVKISDTERLEHNYKICGVIKDVVAFYNSYGGYIIAGIDDQTRSVMGFDSQFSVDDIQKRSKAATGHEIECNYVVHLVETPSGSRSVGLLYIPKRPYSLPPAQFRREASKSPNSDQVAYHANDIYFRSGDECRPARFAEDFAFLCGTSRREISFAEEFRRSNALLNNLGQKDPGFISFVGREALLRILWRWVCDGYTPVKILAGIGGVGKTTLAREFAEDIIRNPPEGVIKLIWLSAKTQFFIAVQGKFQPTTRLDFGDTRSLLRALLLELGTPEELIDPEGTTNELSDQVTEALRLFPSIIVIDDVDSLSAVEQQDVFQTIAQITAETMGRPNAPSLALLTARLDLGAAPRQLLRVPGLDFDEFWDYCKMTAQASDIPFGFRKNTPVMKQFHSATDGSPTFAASILSFMKAGASLDVVIKQWKGRDGDEARRFAFANELNQLSDSQIRTLYAACLLGETSRVELQAVLDSTDRLLDDDMAALRKYHLVALGDELPGGAQIVIPSSLALFIDVIAKRIRDPHRVERACEKMRRSAPALSPTGVARAIRRTTSLSKEGLKGDALQVAQVADREFPDNPDVKCLLGRAYLEMVPSDSVHAERQFRRAFELKCTRHELSDLWLKATATRDDWMGVREIASLFDANPTALLYKIEAYRQLGEGALKSGNVSRAAERWQLGMKELEQGLTKGKLRGREIQAKTMGRELAERIIWVEDRMSSRGSDRFSVWRSVVDGTRWGIYESSVIDLGIRALEEWWGDVEKRPVVDKKATELMFINLQKLDSIMRDIRKSDNTQKGLMSLWEDARNRLLGRVSAYGE